MTTEIVLLQSVTKFVFIRIFALTLCNVISLGGKFVFGVNTPLETYGRM